jgi:hypothetical protein
MAYKKYIKKNGKIYGPYLYHSRRVDDKVISEYYGHQKKRNYKNIIISVSFVLIIFLAIYGFNYIKPYLSGKAVFNIDADYQEGQSLDGVLKLSLNQGEMIPSSTKIIFNNNGNLAEYPLSDFVFEEEASKGDFYIQGKNISGKGEGYGLIGEKNIYPIVHFSFNVYSANNSETNLSAGGGSEEDTPIVISETPNETSAENSTEDTANISTEASIVISETPNEASTDTPSEIPVETPNETPETPVETSGETSTETPVEAPSEEPTEILETPVETPSETPNAQPEDSAPSITGNIISTIFKGISNLFLGLTGTGKVVLDVEKTIEGNVSSGNPFIYTLQGGETAELEKGSVYLIDSKGKEKKIDDSSISFSMTNGRIIVDTDYSEVEQGFGEEYLGNEEKTIYLNFSSLNLLFEKGNLSVSLAYENQEIVSLVTSLEEGKIITNETLTEIPILNGTIFLNQTNQTLENTMKFVSSDNLSEEEKVELSVYFGNFSITTTKSEVFNGRLIRNYKIGDYEIEYSYDYDGKITPELEEQMQRDLMKWLRDILTEVSKEKSSSEQIESLLGNYSLGNENKTSKENNDTIEAITEQNFTEEILEQNLTEEILENSTI